MNGDAVAPAASGTPASDLGALRSAARRGSAWTIGGYAAANALRLVGNVVLARLLFPEAFGLMAIVHAFIQGLWLFTDIGVAPAIVQSERGDDPRFLDTAWTIQAARGLALCLLSFLIAWPVARFYSGHDPLGWELLLYIPVMGVTAVLDGVASTRLFSYSRHLRVRELTMIEVGTQAASLAVMVALAWAWPSVWALVVGALFKSALRTLCSHLLEGAPNRPRWDPEAARALFLFGRWVFVSTILTFLTTQADRLLFGALVPWDVLGVYGIAAALAAMPIGALLQLGSKIVFPVLSRLRDRDGELAREATRTRVPLLVGAGALVSAMIPAAPAFIALFYDARYAAAGWMVQLLFVGAWFQILESQNTALLLARGETRSVALGNAVKLVGLGALLPLGFHAYGVAGAIGGIALADAAKYAATTAIVRRRGVRALSVDVPATALVAATWLLGVVGAGLVEGLGPLVAAGVATTLGVVPWALAALALWRFTRPPRDLPRVAPA